MKPRRVFFKVSESLDRKGIETFYDEEALKRFGNVYKNQIASALLSAFELLTGQQIITGGYNYEQETDNRGGQTPEIVDKDIQSPMPNMQNESIPSDKRYKRKGNGKDQQPS